MSLFNFRSFNSITPFCKQAPLLLKVMSDHVELLLKTPKKHVIRVWNISNEKYANYFNMGPFKETHLYTPEKFVFKNGCLNDQQIDMIVDQFKKNEMHIQVVIEGYGIFYEALMKKLKDIGKYELVMVMRDKPDINSQGIIVNTNVFTILASGVLTEKYKEDTYDKELWLPYVHLSVNLVVCAIHVHGCESQNPKEGLKTLALMMNKLKIMFPDSDIVGLGDFNTIPDYIQQQITFGNILVSSYPTHVNPFAHAANYDNVLVITKDISGYELLSDLSEPNKALVQSIEQNRKQYMLDE